MPNLCFSDHEHQPVRVVGAGRWCVFSLLLMMTCVTASAADKPNIIVIMTDDMSPFDVSAYHRGLGAVTTKNIDRLAREGLMVSD